MPRCAISIDVDSIDCYFRIHALGRAPAHLSHTIISRTLPRFLEVFERRGIRATFFCVAGDLDERLDSPEARAARALVREIASRGHEIGNHSYSHPYELARLAEPTVRDEIARAHHVLERVARTRVRGFRAPGYDVSAAMLDQLERLGYAYDSSIFPAPGYYAAKAAVMAALWLGRRPSGAVLTDPRALLAPTEPYRPDARAPWRPGRAALVELPISVTPRARVPAIGTSLLLAPGWLRRRVLAAVTRRPFFNFEWHGIDLCDAKLDEIPDALRARQPDLRVPLAEKLGRLEAMLDTLAETCEFVRLVDQAEITQRQA